MKKLSDKKLFILVSAIIVVVDCTIDILLLRALFKDTDC
jgi:hypothetical protein